LARDDINSRVLVIGIEGATWRVLTPAIEMGYMPFLRHLINRGASGTLFSTIPPTAAPAWATLQTGREPGSTGIFCSTIFDKSARTLTPIDASLVPQTVWDHAAAAGKRVAMLNIPLSRPPMQTEGTVVIGRGSPSGEHDFTWPPELADELSKVIPGYGSAYERGGIAQPHTDVANFVEKLAAAIAQETRVAEHIIFTRSPDLCMVHFHACDELQHVLWCYLDTADPLYDEDKHRYILEQFYGAVDQGIKDACDAFTRAASGDVTAFVISDSGFEMHKKRFHLGTWLMQQGLLHSNEDAAAQQTAQTSLWARLLIRLGLRQPAPVREADASPLAGRVNWQTSPTFVVGDGCEAGIYLLSDNDAHRLNTIARITKGLKAVRDPFTSAPVVQGVYRREELYRGPSAQMLPDLVVVPVAGYSLTCSQLPDRPLIEDIHPGTDVNLGKHQREGIIVACGPGIADKIGFGANLADTAPSILYILGLDIPATCDGKVAMDLFTEDFTTSRGQPHII
jgi:predicted AlkP superfamily phosphohydrolase/phosphomutase